MTKMSQEIASLKVKCKELDSEKGCSSGADNDDVQDDAGNQLGSMATRTRKEPKEIDSLGASNIGYI
jgi:hypothetical protein